MRISRITRELQGEYLTLRHVNHLLVEEAILVVLTIDLETEIYRISDRHAIISEDVRRAQEQWLLYSTVHRYKINCCKSLAKIVPRDC